MSTVDTNYIEEGATTNVTVVNTVYSDTATATITDENTRTEWVTLQHLNQNTALVDADTDGVTASGITSLTYVGISTETVAYVLKAGDVLRLHANIYSGENTVTDDTVDDYWLAFFWTRDDGGGPVNEQIGPDHCYSFCSTDAGGAHQEYNYQRHGFSYVYIHSGADRTITTFEVHAKVEDATNSLAIVNGVVIALQIRGA